MELIKDYAEYIVGVPSLIIAALISMWIFKRQNKQKKLEYEVVTNEQVIGFSEHLKNDVEVSYQGNIIEALHMSILKVINTGNVPLLSSDFEQPLEITTDDGEIIDCDLMDVNPRNLKVEYSIDQYLTHGKRVFEVGLMNPSDEFSIKVLSLKKITPIIIGRIVGVKSIEQKRKAFLSKSDYSKLLKFGLIVAGVFYLLMLLLFSLYSENSFNDIITDFDFQLMLLISGLGIGLIFILMIIFQAGWKRFRNK